MTAATGVSTQGGRCRDWPAESGFIREVLDRIGDTWSVLVISTLGNERLRYSDLHASIPGISQRMLTVTVKALERDGLLVRTAHPEVPPRVEYELTDLGRSLLTAVNAMALWAASHAEEVTAIRAEHDRTGVGRDGARSALAASA